MKENISIFTRKFASNVLDTKIKQKELVNKSDIFNLIRDSGLNTKLGTLATKAEFKAEQDKIKKLHKLFS